ncbi:carbon starvation CstA family protein [Geodermatophilus obscurus]|uniref:Carbon starvation protein CstA n=1 Tax=Geodermatophilus obscurus (strain ATCC 25078 / DSM 43160 / JCM 3152 / CCUG 61914 / KCC A-0152 / KCTC 9177 / NBRC 13315 / NRRL B-3577 / G-20) TaxID=526225 RepID=D2SAU5_GEOOG|nr:carbon starvation CstA family protein [Geodermatophilus obscurus]ADB75980.1 carbon starvation protein CstA [Geodermatophilus obscurus DSM 43160]
MSTTVSRSDTDGGPPGGAGRRRPSLKTVLVWTAVAIVGAVAWTVLALARGETVSALWILFAALSSYAIAYRFYAKFIARRVLQVDDRRATPAERLHNGIDFDVTDRRVLFGHHFAAIAGAGPLVGPVLAAQMGYLPGTIWIIVGVIFAGAVQDMTVLFFSMRRNGKSLGQMVREEIGIVGGIAALIAVFAIMIIILAVLALIVVNALAESPWGVFSIALTIPIALFMGVYLRTIRPGRVLEATAIGVVLLLAAVIGGGLIDDTGLGEALTLSKEWLVLALVVYGFVASVLPVWLLLTPRDYLSTFMKIGVIVLLAVGLLLARPVLQADAVSEFAREGTGPVFAGSLFPFVFITIACGALSGFHALISSGTTPKMVAKEGQVRLIGYGGMLMESFVAISALIAAVVIDQGLYFAMNAPAGVTGGTAESAAAYVNGLGFDTTAQDLAAASAAIQEPSLVSRTGGAPTLAVGIANILSQAFGAGMAAFWYHFAIMFEALFILTAVDAGTRVGRFMLQDTIGNVWKRFGDLSWRPGNIMASAVVVALWGYILYVGVTDPLGGVNQLFPLFGIANQLLAGIALTLVTVLLIKHGKAKYAWVTGIPLAWDLIITMTASWQKVFSADPRVGYFAQRQRYADAQAAGELLAPAQSAEQMDRIIYNSTLNGVLQAVFALLVLVVVVNAVVVIARALRARGAVPTTEEPAVPSSIVEPSGLFATAEEKRAMAEQERLVGAGTRGHGTFTEEGPSR